MIDRRLPWLVECNLLQLDWESDNRQIEDFWQLVRELKAEYEVAPIGEITEQIADEISELKRNIKRLTERQKRTEDRLIDLGAPGWTST